MKTDDVLDAIDAPLEETAGDQWHMDPRLPVVPVTRFADVVVWAARIGADGLSGEWVQIGTIDTREAGQ